MRSLRRLGSPPTASDDPTAPAAASKLDNFGSKERNVLLVYYLGSVTLVVVAALRHLSRLPVRQYRGYD
ncbi:hypothetical protein PR001_g8371 [Phytophthora rubi]|uniref:Uncharacterized protein n=2 Tax=Phytophthora rubi TaxID=129364 RepID=A0A6A3N6Y8_9STRA|nr:hypothetical protein PR001_g8371 [Phytophthora rubi]